MARYKQTANNEALNSTHKLEATAETQPQLLVEARKLCFTRLQKELAETQERNRVTEATDAKVVRQIAQLKSNLEKINAFYDEH